MLNKKGYGFDIFVWIIVSFITVLALSLFYYGFTQVGGEFREQTQDMELLNSGQNLTETYDDTWGKATSSYELLKWGTVALIIGMAISMILGAFLITVNPIFMIAYIFIEILAILVSVPLANVYEEIYLNPTLSPTLTGFMGASYIMLHLPYWVFGIMSLVLLVMFINYMRNEGQGSGGSWI